MMVLRPQVNPRQVSAAEVEEQVGMVAQEVTACMEAAAAVLLEDK
jgi:hypothetical protein